MMYRVLCWEIESPLPLLEGESDLVADAGGACKVVVKAEEINGHVSDLRINWDKDYLALDTAANREQIKFYGDMYQEKRREFDAFVRHLRDEAIAFIKGSDDNVAALKAAGNEGNV